MKGLKWRNKSGDGATMAFSPDGKFLVTHAFESRPRPPNHESKEAWVPVGPALRADERPPVVRDGWIELREPMRAEIEQGLRKHPVGEATITLTRPTPQQVRKRLEELFAQKVEAGYYPFDFTLLRDPAYLLPLQERAEEGQRRGLAGLGGIATPEATRALIRLAGIALRDYELEVVQTLRERLPDTKGLPYRYFNLQRTGGAALVRAAILARGVRARCAQTGGAASISAWWRK